MKEYFKIGSPLSVIITVIGYASLLITIFFLFHVKFNHPDVSLIPAKNPSLGEVYYYDKDNWYPAVDLDLTKGQKYIVVWIGNQWTKAEW